MGIEQILKNNILFNERLSTVTNGGLVSNDYKYICNGRTITDGGNYTVIPDPPYNVSYKTFDASFIPVTNLVLSTWFIDEGNTFSFLFSYGSSTKYLRGFFNRTDYAIKIDDGNGHSVSIAFAASLNTINNLIVVFNQTDSIINIYINGVLAGSSSLTWDTFQLNATAIIGELSTENTSTLWSWNGMLDDTTIFNLDGIFNGNVSEEGMVESIYNNRFSSGTAFKFIYEYSDERCQTYTLDTNGICERALKKLGVYTFGNSPRIEDMTSAKTELNIMVKNWRANNVFIWKTDWKVIPLVQSDFIAGTDGCYECIRSHNSTIYDTPISGTNYLGYWKKKYNIWAVSTAYTDGDIVLGDDGLLYESLSDHTSSATDEPITGVSYATYWGLYTTITPTTWASQTSYHSICNIKLDSTIIGNCKRVIGLGNAFLRNSSSQDTYLNQSLQAHEYFRMGDKFNSGRPTMIYFKRDRTIDEFLIYPYPDTTQYVLNVELYMYPDNFDEADDSADFVDEWIKPLIDGLAYNLYSYYPGKNRVSKGELKVDFDESYSNATASDSEKGDIQFSPDYFYSSGRY